MAKFVKRTTCPDKNSKYYNKDNIFTQCGYGMFQNGGNCTAYAWGRWYELLGEKPKLCTSNAENWFKYTKDGYKRGNVPKLGAIAVWAKGQVGNEYDGAGHVAVVEEIYSDGSILTSNSGWLASLFYTQKHTKGYKMNGYTFQGFIYLPIEFDVPDNTNRYVKGRNYTLQVDLKVRKAPGTDKAIKLRKELTKDGQKHSYNQKYAVLKKGTKVTCLGVANVGSDVWMSIPSGWVAGFYNNEVYIK